MYYEIDGSTLPQIRLIDMAALEPPYLHKKRQVDEYVLYIIKKGKMYLRENNINYTLEAGDVLLLDPKFTHQGIKTSECEYYYIHFRHPSIVRRQKKSHFINEFLSNRSKSLQEDSNSFEIYIDSVIYFPKYVRLQNGNSLSSIIKLIQGAMDENLNQIENYKVSCSCRVMEILIKIAREALSSRIIENRQTIPQSHNNVYELLSYLNTNYDKEISGDLIEDMFCCNFDYLNRVFKEIVGTTIFVYLNEVRIKHAKRLIATTSTKMAAVAYRVGFKDEYYFSKVFKKYTGMSPSKYERLTSQIVINQEKTVV